MSQYSEIMEALEAQDVQLSWLVAAVKHLLSTEAGWQPEEILDDLDIDEDMSEFEFMAVRGQPAPTDKPCPHNRQGLGEGGRLVCIRCGTDLAQTGVVGRDPQAPIPGTQTREASSKNPGTPLVPY